jgi:hypothetical protein
MLAVSPTFIPYVPTKQRDEDFDESYESLISLAAALGEAKPRGAPPEIVEKMDKGKYKNWKTDESDVRCPICLDDVCFFLSFQLEGGPLMNVQYEPDDPVLKLNNCSHWLHHDCLHVRPHSSFTSSHPLNLFNHSLPSHSAMARNSIYLPRLSEIREQ